jgi:2-polyprenyl-6-methoxyphenol hydroxylase-like FAD-dependent oxidoreductase
VTGARESVEAAGFRRVRTVHVKWEAGAQVREDAREQGVIVDRGEFDRLLLERARALGVRVLQPATVVQCSRRVTKWSLAVEAGGDTVQVDADFLANACGRTSGSTGGRRWTGRRMLALYAYWRGAGLPRQPRIEAGEEAWYWGVPLPDGTYNTLVFVDVKRFRDSRVANETLAARFLELLHRSALMADCRDAQLVGPVSAIDATPYIDEDSAMPSTIKVGDAALAIDPLSSSGVQKAIQGALSAAIVANTLLRRPEMTDPAIQFYRSSLAEASERHCRWAASHYDKIAGQGGGPFWQDRATGPKPAPVPPPTAPLDAFTLSAVGVGLSRNLEFVDLPCLDGDFVTLKPAVRHPGLEGPVAYLGGRELAPLLRGLPVGATPLQIARSWADRIPLESGLAIAGWMLNKGILVSHECGPREGDR